MVNKIGQVLAFMELYILLREEKSTRLLLDTDTCYKGEKKEWLLREASLKRWRLRCNINNKETAIWKSKLVTFQVKDAQSVWEWIIQETCKYSTLLPIIVYDSFQRKRDKNFIPSKETQHPKSSLCKYM